MWRRGLAILSCEIHHTKVWARTWKTRLGCRRDRLAFGFSVSLPRSFHTHFFRQETVPRSFPDLPFAFITIGFALCCHKKKKKSVPSLFNVKTMKHMPWQRQKIISLIYFYCSYNFELPSLSSRLTVVFWAEGNNVLKVGSEVNKWCSHNSR